jgi:hypothetical protein
MGLTDWHELSSRAGQGKAGAATAMLWQISCTICIVNFFTERQNLSKKARVRISEKKKRKLENYRQVIFILYCI